MRIIIPSHRRAGRVITQKFISGVELCVPESQAADYRRGHPDLPVIPHPDSVIGLSAKRQWIIRNLGDVMMIDDDCEGIRRRWRPNRWPIPCTMSADEARDLILETAETARRLGAYLFGYCSIGSSEWYDSHRPIRFGPFIRGCNLGILEGSKLFFPERAFQGEDDFICLLNAHHHRFMLMDTRFYVSCRGTGESDGGCAEFRNPQIEQSSLAFLRRAFGEAFQLRAEGGTLAKEAKATIPWRY